MPKMKTNKSVAKRIRRSKTGKLMRPSAFRRHRSAHKTQKRMRQLRRPGQVHPSDAGRLERALPYG